MTERPSINPNKPDALIGKQVSNIARMINNRAAKAEGTSQPELTPEGSVRTTTLEHFNMFNGANAETTLKHSEFDPTNNSIVPDRANKTTVRSQPFGLPEGSVDVSIASTDQTGAPQEREVMYVKGTDALQVYAPGQDEQAVINQLPGELMAVRNEIAARRAPVKQPAVV